MLNLVATAQVGLRDEGFDPNKVTDPVFWLNPATRRFEPFQQATYRDLVAGKAKL